MSDVPSDPKRAEGSQRVPYVAPRIEWEEVIEEAGVFAACVKDPAGNGGPQCGVNPMAASAS